MTYRSIFVHNDDSPDTERRIDIATRLATVYPAELVGAYVVPGFSPPPFASAMMASEIAQRSRQDTIDRARAAEARFRDAGDKAGIGKLTWRTPKGDPFDATVLEARYCDLTVLGQPSHDHPDAAFNAELANAVLMLSGRPVLFVPFVGIERTIGERILIAWKDSRESARAVADALPFLKDAKKVHALAVTAEHDESRRELLSDQQLSEFLARHGVEATVKRIVAPDIDAGELLLSQAADIGADLIVMGGYSRPRITQLVWGGVTRLMLSSMTVPVLMSH